MYSTVNASLSLHNRLLHHLLRLPKSFFDTNPAGRVLNRFSRDVEVMDSVLNQSAVQFLSCVFTYLAILVVISVATKWFAIAVVPVTAVYFILQRYYVPSARELQRIEVRSVVVGCCFGVLGCACLRVSLSPHTLTHSPKHTKKTNTHKKYQKKK